MDATIWIWKRFIGTVKKGDEMRLIAGTFDGTEETRYWRVHDFERFSIGDYAIVENRGGYALVRIVGDIYTSEGFVRSFSNTPLKRAVKIEDTASLNRGLEDLDID